MKLSKAVKICDLVHLIGGEIVGDSDAEVQGINEIHKVEPGDLTFVNHPKYYKKALSSNATFIIINHNEECPEGKVLILHDDPFLAYNQLVAKFYHVFDSFNLNATIGNDVNIHPTAQIHQGVVIGHNVSIGEGSIIFPNTVIYDNVHIGKNVIIHANSVIGAHAFYFAKPKNSYVKWHSCGYVTIEDSVEIGASCTIDKGVSGETKIGEGTKLDNHIHVGHGVVIGKNCLFAAQCGIGGKTVIEDDVICWGQVGISKSLTVGKGAVLLAQTGVSKSIKGATVYGGAPAQEARKWHKDLAWLRTMAKEGFNNRG